jgi:hypothetical protein
MEAAGSTHEIAAPGAPAPANTTVGGVRDWPPLAMVFLIGVLGYTAIGIAVYALLAAYL